MRSTCSTASTAGRVATITSANGDGDGTSGSVEHRSVRVRGTHLAVEIRGSGDPVLLVHGGGEDSSMLAGQAESLADAGFRVISYDRRGTGRSGRDSWPGSGAPQHADDAAALLDSLGHCPATVVGVSSGGVVAMALATRHPEAVDRVVAWEPPAVGVLPGGTEMNAALMAPVEEFLRTHPGDFAGAQAMLLTMILGFQVTSDDPAFAAARANAEPMIRDEPRIPEFTFAAQDFVGLDVTVAVGDEPNDIVAAAVARLAELTGRPTTTARGPHEVYHQDPQVLTDLVLLGAER